LQEFLATPNIAQFPDTISTFQQKPKLIMKKSKSSSISKFVLEMTKLGLNNVNTNRVSAVSFWSKDKSEKSVICADFWTVLRPC